MKAEPGERTRRRPRLAERLHRHARGEILPGVRIGVGAAARAVGYAVEHAGAVGGPSAPHVALYPENRDRDSVRIRRERTFREQHIRVAVQQLVANRHLVLAGPDAERAREADIDVGIRHHGLPAAEVGHHLEVEVAAHAAAERRAQLANGERARNGDGVVQLELAIELRHHPEGEPVVAISRLDEEPAVLKARRGLCRSGALRRCQRRQGEEHGHEDADGAQR